MNGYQGQIRAIDQNQHCFLANVDIVDLIKDSTRENNNKENLFIKKLGIFTAEGTEISLTVKGGTAVTIKIGKTKMYQLDEVQIVSIKFVENSPVQTIIDFIIDV